MMRGAWLGLAGIAIAAWFLRVGDLAERPMHNDEAINAFKLQELWLKGRYRYDPHEYHGPALYYASLPVLAAAEGLGRGPQPTEAGMRLVAALFGVGLILSLGLVADAFGRAAVWLGGAFIAVSPAMVYYSRYYIHEMALVFFTAIALGALWRYSRRPGIAWAATAGAGVGLMYATKETFVFAMAAAAGAWVIAVGWPSRKEARAREASGCGSPRVSGLSALLPALRDARASHLAAFVTGAAVMFVVFFTSFFTHASGPLDAARTYLIWLQRAGGASPHVHPWWFYFERLGWFRERGGPLWTEIGALALALAGAVVVWRGKGLSETGRKAGRFVVLYAAFLAAIYGVIPYKTPWCLLGFYHPLLLLAGIGLWGIATAGRAWGWKVGAAVIGLAVAGHLTAQAWRASREFAADYRNPYVYAHTAPDLKNLLDLVARVSRASPDGNDTPIQVMVSDSGYWPLPWYWRDREQVGWWDEAHEGPFAPIVIAGSKLGLNLEEKTEGRWFLGGMFELRPRVFVEVYVETGLWKAFLERQRRERG